MKKAALSSVVVLLAMGTAYAVQQRAAVPKGNTFIVSRRTQEHREFYTMKKGARPNGKWVVDFELGPSAGLLVASLRCSVGFDDQSGACFSGKTTYLIKINGKRVIRKTLPMEDCQGATYLNESFDLTDYAPEDTVECTASVKKVKPRFSAEASGWVAGGTHGILFEVPGEGSATAPVTTRSQDPGTLAWPDAPSRLASVAAPVAPAHEARGPKRYAYGDGHFSHVDFYEREVGSSPKGTWTTSIPLGVAAASDSAFIYCQNSFYDNDESCPSGKIRYTMKIGDTVLLKETSSFPKDSCETYTGVGDTVDLSDFDPTDELVCRAVVRNNKQRFVNTHESHILVSISTTDSPATTAPVRR